MTGTNELETGLKDLHRSWNRIHDALIPRTLREAIFLRHDDVTNYVIEQFSERIGIRTMDSRIIPATTGGVPKDEYARLSQITEDPRIPKEKKEEVKDQIYHQTLRDILQQTQPSRQLMFIGMRYQLLKDYFVEDTQIKPGDQYVKEEIEFEMRNGDGSYRRHVPKMYAEQIASQVVQISAMGKDKLMDLHQACMEKQEEQEPKQPRINLPGQMQQRPRSGSPRGKPQKPKREESPSGLITTLSLEDIRKYTR